MEEPRRTYTREEQIENTWTFFVSRLQEGKTLKRALTITSLASESTWTCGLREDLIPITKSAYLQVLKRVRDIVLQDASK